MTDNAWLSWRDGVLIAAGLAAVYLMMTLLRLLRVSRDSAGSQQSPAPSPLPPPLNRPAKPAARPATELTIDLSRNLPENVVSSPPVRTTAAAETAPEPAPAHESAPGFAHELARSSVEAELQRLRRESASLRDELSEVREELSALKAARNVSPLYSEAMALAQRGITADGIAGQCGISLAEAELVAALARGETDDRPYPSDEDTHDDYQPRANAKFPG